MGMALTLFASACGQFASSENSSVQSSVEENSSSAESSSSEESSSSDESSSSEESSSPDSGVEEPEKQEYTIIFRQEGAADIIKTVEEGETLIDIPTPTEKVGYTVAWDRTDFTNVTENVTVTATYTPNVYTITYDADGFAIDGTTVEFTYDAVCEDLDMSLTQAGKIFLGWNYNGVTYTNASVWKVAENVTLVAEWMEKDQIVVAFVEADGATMNRTGYKGESFTDIPIPKDKVGYAVDKQNWYADEACTIIASFEALQESITVYAKATANVYTITYDADGFAIDGTNVELTYDAVCENLDMSLTQVGKIFLGWNYNGVTYTNASVWKVAENVTLVAEWVEKDQIVITFVEADGATVNQTIYKGETLIDIPTPKDKVGYTVDKQNWYADEACTIIASFEDMKESITVYAKATANVYVISFEQEGQPTKKFSVVYGQPFSDIPTPAPKTGYIVTWNRTDFTGIAENVTVTTVETAKTFTIVFEAVGGEAPARLTVTYGKAYSLPNAVSEEYNFGYWMYNGEKIASSGTWLIDSDSETITLNVKWGGRNWSGVY